MKSYQKDLADQLRIVENDAVERLERLLVGKTANGGPKKLARGSKIIETIASSTTSTVSAALAIGFSVQRSRPSSRAWRRSR